VVKTTIRRRTTVERPSNRVEWKLVGSEDLYPPLLDSDAYLAEVFCAPSIKGIYNYELHVQHITCILYGESLGTGFEHGGMGRPVCVEPPVPTQFVPQ